MKKYDIIIILFILLISFFSYLIYQNQVSNNPLRAEIYHYSELVETVPLDQGIDRIFSVKENENVIFHLFINGNICFEESDCPDKLCIKTGKISKPGQFAACLPNGLLLKIVSADYNNRDVDIIVGN
ncbi:MAG: NusG domain II-containing protein [Candidatus Caldatribacteriota bacterium]